MLNPLQFEFMREAAVVGMLVAVSCAMLSCFLVLRGWALMGDAISHAVLPGIVGAYWLGLPLSLGAFASGLLCALASGHLKATSRVKEDTVIGVVFSGMFALGLVMMSKTTTDVHLDHILYGNILGLTDEQVLETWIIGAAVVLVAFLKRRDFLLLGFDPAHARALGLRSQIWHYTLLVLLALAVVTALKAVGLILAVSLLVTPGATAHLVTKRLDAMLAVAVSSAILATLAGLWVAFAAGASAGGSIVLAQGALFVAAALWRRLSQGVQLSR